MNENDKRSDKFFAMNYVEFNTCVRFALRNGDRKISYSKGKDSIVYGGMADSFEEALEWCKKFYEEDNTCDLCIGDFTGQGMIWDKTSILHELGIISEEEYDEYLENQRLDED